MKDEEVKQPRLHELAVYLRKQLYPESLINNGIERAKLKGPITSDQRQTKTNSLNEVIPFVTTFNPRNKNVFPVMKSFEQVLKRSDKMNRVLQRRKIINSKRQPKNLKRILSKSKFDFIPKEACVSKCGTPRCKTCPDILEGSTIKLKTGKQFTVKQDMNCKSRNVIYTLVCCKCKDFYIGQTKTELRKRMTVHRQQTRTDDLRLLKVNKHFHQCSGGRFNIFPIYKVLGGNDFIRDQRESYFIKTLHPTLNAI